MDIVHFKSNLEKRALKNALVIHLNDPASNEDILRAENRLSIGFPQQIKMFYQHYNGVSLEDPHLEVLPLNELGYQSEGKIYFASFDNSVKVCFEINRLNEAKQWDIVNCENGFLITRTMASFWSNKVFA